MNIFYVDKDPICAAQSLCNKHVVKMVIETAQLLSTAHHVNPNPKIDYTNSELGKILKKKTHTNHPSAIWCRKTYENYNWLARHGVALSREYTFRYEKTHALHFLLLLLKNNTSNFELVGFSEPPQCMPDEFKVENDAVTAYRNYYNVEKRRTVKCEWKKRETPFWWTIK